MPEVFTIGHSTRRIGDFIELLQEAEVRHLIDVRRYPGSRRHPQYNREPLARSLGAAGIAYRHMEVLGGRRGDPDKDSANGGWHNKDFRAYADYLNRPEIQDVVEDLAGLSRRTRFALMCAEAAYHRCHRQLIADALVARKVDVYHLDEPGQPKPHTLNEMARIDRNGRVIYPAPGTNTPFQQSLFED